MRLATPRSWRAAFSWLLLPDAHGWQVGASALLALVIIFCGLWLRAGSFAYFRVAEFRDTASVWPAFRLRLSHIIALALWAIPVGGGGVGTVHAAAVCAAVRSVVLAEVHGPALRQPARDLPHGRLGSADRDGAAGGDVASGCDDRRRRGIQDRQDGAFLAGTESGSAIGCG